MMKQTDVAIIGVAGRFPGARNVAELWQLLREGREGIARFDDAALVAAGVDGELLRDPAYVRAHGAVDGVELFDAAFFDVTPAEAEITDPQQRIFLECCHEALESAGYDPERFAGLISVYAGASMNGYLTGHVLPATEQLSSISRQFQVMVGNDKDYLATRVSYKLNLRGPSYTIQTACSTSLVAVHLACQGLIHGECDLALAGGVTVKLPQVSGYRYEEGSILSADGRVRTFDAGATGTVLGNGAGVIVLKLLAGAIADGDSILAVIKGTAANNDGSAKVSYAAPAKEGQAAVIEEALAVAGVSPDTIGYVEAHGTATRLGDPVEVAALTRAFRKTTDRTGFCGIGSIKSNIGHLDAAAGIAGLTKVALMLSQRTFVPTLHCERPNPDIGFAETPFVPVTELREWSRFDGVPRRAGVSSFGIGGTNAHAILEEAPPPAETSPGRPDQLLVLSARTPSALARMRAGLADFLRANREVPLADVAFTLATGRRVHAHRFAVVCRTAEEAAALLERDDVPDAESPLAPMRKAWLLGDAVDWSAFYGHERRRRVPVPTYPFERQRFWIDPPRRTAAHLALEAVAEGVLSARIPADAPWVRDHVAGEQRVLPAAVMLELARAAGERAHGRSVRGLAGVSFERMLAFDTAARSIDIAVRESRFEIRDHDGVYARGELLDGEEPREPSLDDGRPTERELDAGACYALLDRAGLHYGFSFRVIRQLSLGDDYAVARLALPDGAATTDFASQPSLLDGALQAAVVLLASTEGEGASYLPLAAGEVVVRAPLPRECTVRVTRRTPARAGKTASLDLVITGGDAVVAWIRDLVVRIHTTAPVLFRPEWIEVKGGAMRDAGPVVVFAGRGAARNGSDVVVTAAESFRRIDRATYELAPERGEDFELLLRSLHADGIAPATLVHGWCSSARGEHTAADRGVASFFHLVKALVAERSEQPVRVVVTHPIADGVASPLHEAMAALARTAMLECPRLQIRVLATDDAASWRAADGKDLEVRFAGGRRVARRYRRAGVPDGESPIAFRHGGVYLISGGAGALGLAFAEHIAARAKAHLILAGRSPLSDAARGRVDAIAPRAASIRHLPCDVTREADVRALVARIHDELGPLSGVLHAAGITRDRFLLRKPVEELIEVAAPKIAGAVYLDRATAGEPLDLFVLFSSVAAAFGSVGQADYAFANAFLDSFAEWREALATRGLRRGRTLSIAWPLWEGGGMTQDGPAAEELRRRTGLRAIAPKTAFAAFDEILALRGGAWIVGSGDAAAIEAALRPEAAVAEPEPVLARATDLLREIVARETKLEPESIDPRAPFERYGIDSLVITRLNTELERHFGKLSKTLFYEYATLGELAAYLAEHHGGRLAGPASAPASIVSPVFRATPRRETEPDDDAIAIIGLSGRYPQAGDLDELWRNLAAGRDCIEEIPAGRWDHTRFAGVARSKWGGFLRDADCFDPLFFAISPREAELMDPQERLFLEIAWHAVEDAGYRARDLAGRAVGVFAGVMYGEYQLYGAADALRGAERVAGSSFASIANRVSYILGLEGPSLAVDTMCSSSLTAIHLACESLRRGESELAIAGGVNLSLHPYKYVFLSQGRFVSADGRCRAFGRGGTGYVPGEGAGAVLLKPRARALADGDRIHGVILGSAVNHGGRTNGYTVPSPRAQQTVVARALQQARVAPRDISYIEAHGTGTSLGDPIEITGLTKAFAGADVRACAIGSIKSNIGHLESAAGIAGLTKVLLQMRHGMLVPSIHSDELNPNIDFDETPFVVQRSLDAWERPRRAGVSSFGAGGSNAHLVVEEHADAVRFAERPAADQTSDRDLLFILSARDEERLLAAAGALAAFLTRERVRLADVACTLQIGREAMEERLAILTRSGTALVEALRTFARGADSPLVRRGRAAEISRDAAAEPGDLEQAAAMWLAGCEIDWTPRGMRVSLPGYPFARERYWLAGAEEPRAAHALHPLLDENLSGLEATRFRRRFAPEEVLLSDHVIHGRRVLSGAACLEMARAAAERAGGGHLRGLRNVAWVRPVVGDEPRDVFVDLRRDGDRVTFELSTANGDLRETHVRGEVVYAAADDAPRRIDLDAIRARCSRRVDREAVEAAYDRGGFAYGSSHRVIESIHIGHDEALAALRLPEAARTTAGYSLDPFLLDGALRACHWSGRAEPAREALAVPSTLAAIDARAPLPETCYAHAIAVAGGHDVVVAGEDGRELARLRGFTGRVPRAEPAASLYELVWEPEPLPDGTAGRGVLLVLTARTALVSALAATGRWARVIAADEPVGALLDSIAADDIDVADLRSFDGGADLHALLELVKAIARSGRKTRCVYVYDGDEPEHEAAAAVARSTSTVAPRCELLTLRCSADALASHVAAELGSSGDLRGLDVRIDGAARLVRRARRIAAGAPLAPPLKRGGVYLIAGASGAIGRIFARYLAERWQARLVLAARSPVDAELLDLRGGEALAVQADVTRAADVERVVDEAKRRFGRIDGVFHIAGTADGVALTAADRDRIDRVLAPKVLGARHLDAATANEPLDCFVLFSSISSVIGDFGACSYAAANRFLDAFAEERQRRVDAGARSGRTLSLAWPLWNAGGVDTLLRPHEREAYVRSGLDAIDPPAAIAAFESAWLPGRSRVIVAAGDPLRFERALGCVTGAPAVEEAIPAGDELVPSLTAWLRREVAVVLKMPEAKLDGATPLDRYGLDSVAVIEITTRLGKYVPDLPGTVFFEHRTLASVARYLAREHASASAAVAGRPAQIAPPVPQTVERPVPAQTAGDDAIAIIGISGRYPRARDLDELWANLVAGRDCVGEIPPERWSADAFFSADEREGGKSYSRWGGFLDDVDAFDSGFFHIAPLQARSMDPQERLFIESAWAAIEDAGYTVASLPAPRFSSEGRDVGVFVGVMWGDYALIGAEECFRGNPVVALDNRASVANQVSWLCDFRGPSLVIDTACSSSLVALHMACESIRRGECRLAIAGGVNVSLHPLKYVHLSRKTMLARDGRCRAFGDGGSGYVPGEGVGAVLLKRLSEAITDGDHIHAVVRASAVNHGGRTNGFTVPSPQAQRALIEEALARGAVDPRTIGCVEAHGTGTVLGDPIEHEALQRAFAAAGDDRAFCSLGSIKSNIGHLEGAAGIAGVTKAVLQLRHRQFVPTLHAGELNPRIDFARSPFVVQRQAAPWPAPASSPRRAAVSSFGAGGTNAHVILEEHVAPESPVLDGGPEIIVLSARDAERLKACAERLAAFLERGGVSFADAAYTLRIGREAMEERLALVASDAADAAAKLRAFARGDAGAGVARGNSSGQSPFAGLFTGARGGEEFLQSLIAAGNDARLAQLWAAGADIDWRVLHQVRPRPRRRVPLPTYPFARQRHWLPVTQAKDVSSRRVYRADDPIVRDHAIDGEPIVPGAAHLDFAAAASGVTIPFALTDVEWLAPAPADRELVFVASPADGEQRFEIRAAGGGAIHCRGVVSTPGESPEPLALRDIERRCPRELTHEAFYDALRARGLAYGTAFRRVDRVRSGEAEALGRLRGDGIPLRGSYALHPGMVDAALQTAGALLADGETALLPFALERADVFRAVPAEGHAYVEDLGGHRFHVTLADSEGVVCVRFTGLSLRARPRAADLTYVSRWTPAPLDPARHRAREGAVLVVAWPDGVELADGVMSLEPGAWRVAADAIEEALASSGGPVTVYAAGITEIEWLLRLARAIEDRPVALKVVTTDAHPELFGLCRGLLEQYPRLELACIDGAGADARAVVDEPCSREPELVRLRGRARATQRLVPLELPRPAAPAFRDRGVYLIVGGLGVVGYDTALHLATRYRARLVLIGRSALDEARRAKIAHLEAAGAEVLSIACDAGDERALAKAIAHAKAHFGAIHGVVHSAMQLDRVPLREATDGEVRAVLDAKMATSRALARVVEDERLDFLLFYSSAIVLESRNAHPLYAAGCAFADALADRLAERLPFPVKRIGWGYWHGAGVGEREEALARLAARGVQPIAMREGMDVVERLLASPVLDVIATKTAGAVAAEVDAIARVNGPSLLPAIAIAELPETPAAVAEQQRASATLARLARPLVREIVETHDPAVVVPRHARLFETLQRFAREDAATGAGDPEAAIRALGETHPAIEATCALLLRCLRAYPALLRGEISDVEVLFPEGSSVLVDGIYAANPVAADCNAAIAFVVREYVAGRVALDPGARVRILEIGAGTGSTTAPVLDALAPHAPNVELTVTDLSPHFVRRAKSDFGARYGFVRFEMLDIESPDRFDGGTFDVVIAANVLHATRRIHDTLDHVKRLLRAGGLLVAGEGIHPDPVMTLIFGITSGWWVFEDAAHRIEGSPLLSAGQWRDVLDARGFRSIRVEERGYGVILAASDGVAIHRAAERAHPQRATGPRPAGAVHESTVAYVTAVLARVLEMPDSQLVPDATFERYGVDSLVALELRNAFEKDLGRLPATLLFEHNTIRRLARHFASDHAAALARVTGATVPEQERDPVAERALDVDDLSDDEVDELVDDLIRELRGAKGARA